MDPLTVLSVATSVIQFLDFGSKLISTSNELYNSVDGILMEHEQISAASKNLSFLSQSITDSFSNVPDRRYLRPEEASLLQTSQSCTCVADDMVDVLENVRAKGGQQRWKTFRQAFLSVMRKEHIDRLQQRLGALRQQLILNFLIDMSNNSSQELRHLNSRIGNMQVQMIEAIQTSRDILQTEISQLQQQLLAATPQREPLILHGWQTQHELYLRRLSNQIFQVVNDSNERTVRQRILDSLYFKQINERRMKIAAAHAKTFAWTLDPAAHTGTRWSNLAEWFGENEGSRPVYWIAGKAGSGKSTLMRYIYEQGETKRLLRQWSGELPLLIGACFFWNPGTEIQKSQRGLLMTLLHQILSQYHGFSANINPERWRSYSLGMIDFGSWTDSELYCGITTFLKETSNNVRVCLFIDGLDEFEGTDDQRMQMLDLFSDMARLDCVKICVSSRPWLIFQDSFESAPQLLLEELTRGDIAAYVEQELRSNSSFRRLERIDQHNCAHLISEIVDKAKGVFLWVRLVVRSLLEGLRNEDDIQLLLIRFRSIPTDLEQYFRQMMSTIDPFYLGHTGLSFQAALKADGPLPLMTYSYLFMPDPEAAITMPMQRLSTDEIVTVHERTARQLNARCKGLLEVHSKPAENVFLSMEVDFLHRTVKDFFDTPEMDRILWSYVKTNVNLHLSVTRAFLMQLKTLDMDDASFEVSGFLILLERLLYHAGKISSRSSASLQNILDATRSVVTQYEHMYADTPQLISYHSYVTDWWLKARGAAGTFDELISIRHGGQDHGQAPGEESSSQVTPTWTVNRLSPKPSLVSTRASTSTTAHGVSPTRSPTSVPVGTQTTPPIIVFKPPVEVLRGQGSSTRITSFYRHLCRKNGKVSLAQV